MAGIVTIIGMLYAYDTDAGAQIALFSSDTKSTYKTSESIRIGKTLVYPSSLMGNLSISELEVV